MYQNSPRTTRREVASRAVKDFPNLPEFSAELAECFALRGDFYKAVENMTAAVEKFKNYNDTEPTHFTEAMLNFAEQRINIWTKFLVENQCIIFDEEGNSKRMLTENIFLMEESHAKN